MLDPEFSITQDVVRACMSGQAVTVEPGDIICVRTGWTEALHRRRRRPALEMFGGEAPMVSSGIAPSLAALAAEQQWGRGRGRQPRGRIDADAPWHGQRPRHHAAQPRHPLRRALLLFGDLARAAAADSRYDFLFVSTPALDPRRHGLTPPTPSPIR